MNGKKGKERVGLDCVGKEQVWLKKGEWVKAS